MADNVIELVHLQKQFGDHAVLRDINLSVKKGEVLSIIGASGSGKSTMLRCINLLETPTSGQVLYHGQDITAKDFNLTQYRTKVGHGVSELQSLQQHVGAQQLYRRSGLRAQAQPQGGRGDRHGIPDEGRHGARISMPGRRSCPADKSSALPLRVRWPCSRRCCCLMSRRARSTRRWSARCSM